MRPEGASQEVVAIPPTEAVVMRVTMDTSRRVIDLQAVGQGMYEAELRRIEALEPARALIDRAHSLQAPGRTYEPKASR
jgi:hypothetical protein